MILGLTRKARNSLWFQATQFKWKHQLHCFCLLEMCQTAGFMSKPRASWTSWGVKARVTDQLTQTCLVVLQMAVWLPRQMVSLARTTGQVTAHRISAAYRFSLGLISASASWVLYWLWLEIFLQVDQPAKTQLRYGVCPGYAGDLGNLGWDFSHGFQSSVSQSRWLGIQLKLEALK